MIVMQIKLKARPQRIGEPSSAKRGEEELFIVDRRLPLKGVVIEWPELRRDHLEQLKKAAFNAARFAWTVARITGEVIGATLVVAAATISITAYSISGEPHLPKSINSMPVGISAVGTSSHTGLAGTVITDKIIGYQDIKELNVAYDATGLNLNGFGLDTYKQIIGSGKGSFQLNAFLLGGQEANQLYWVQNVAEFNTETSETGKVYFMMNLWSGTSQLLLAHATRSVDYTLPMKMNLSFSLKTFDGSEYLLLSYQINNKPIDTYYTYKLPNTFVLVSSGFTPTDLVFCGPYNSEIAYASKIDASLALYYDDNGKILPFSNINTEDLSLIHTGESAANVNAYLGSDSFINLSTGNPTNINLTNFSPHVPK